MSETYSGRILKGVGGNYWVSDEKGHEGMASARGILRQLKERPAAGDRVTFTATKDPVFPYRILSIAARRNALPRPQVVNVDQLILVFAVKSPDPDFMLLDKLAAIAAARGIEVLIVFTKLDLADEPELVRRALRERYAGTGWLLFFSAGHSTDEAEDYAPDTACLERLRPALCGKLSALAGPSGSGKSTLLNHLTEKEHMATGGVSERLGRGRHTTRHAELFRFEDGYVVDTPGFTMLDILDAGIEPEELPNGFPEIYPAAFACRFNTCHHLDEPGCAVRGNRAIHAERYGNYRRLREILDQHDPYA